MIKHPEQRVGLFVDVGNMYHSAKNLFGAKVNFKAVLQSGVAERKLVRAVAYVIRSKSEEEQKFFEALDKQGYELKMKDLQVFYGGAKKGDWDVGLTMDMVQMMSKLDVIIIVSGDGDYEDAVRFLKAHGNRVEAIAFGRSTSTKLKEVVDDFIDLDLNPRKFLMPMRR